MTIQPKRNIRQEKAIAFFEQLNIMDAMQTIEGMKIILNQKIEDKKKKFSDEILTLNQMQEKLKEL